MSKLLILYAKEAEADLFLFKLKRLPLTPEVTELIKDYEERLQKVRDEIAAARA